VRRKSEEVLKFQEGVVKLAFCTPGHRTFSQSQANVDNGEGLTVDVEEGLAYTVRLGKIPT
jgi:hypothetical protein